MTGILILLLVLAIFLGAVFFVTKLIPEPYRRWVLAILVVVGAIIAINWLLGGGLQATLGSPHYLPR